MMIDKMIEQIIKNWQDKMRRENRRKSYWGNLSIDDESSKN